MKAAAGCPQSKAYGGRPLGASSYSWFHTQRGAGSVLWTAGILIPSFSRSVLLPFQDHLKEKRWMRTTAVQSIWRKTSHRKVLF